ncbi:MAG: YifB family Mg chelatase-like AAA ATPase [Candidatus Cloacimonetes bacterium]|nr:YifB family Mg chelatase-like AAA ATPase [Candidatus Cloacimonadota bacterium]
MLGRAISFTTVGIDAQRITIESDSRGGLSVFTIVGMATNSVKESKDRVCSAIRNNGWRVPNLRYTINLAPADIKKDGSSLDLPIAVSLLMTLKYTAPSKIDEYALIGELSLDGTLRPVKGVLPIAVQVAKEKLSGLILPSENAAEAAIVDGLNVYPVDSLMETVQFLEGKIEIKPFFLNKDELFNQLNHFNVDMYDVKGQYFAKRALEVAAAGGHNLIMIGPPGSGKTMLARRLPTILPDITLDEAIETTKIHSVSGLSATMKESIVTSRPFRSPHHTISDIALIGGGAFPKPGEVSLAHNGVLFLDELPEFKKNVLEVMRQPLEDGVVSISRAAQSLAFPAQFMLIASMNPCPCGYFGSDVAGHTCNCGYELISRYRSRISGPLLDRIDIHIEVPAVSYEELKSKPAGEKSLVVRDRVNKARQIQLDRFKEEKIFCNAQMSSRMIRKYCELDDDCHSLIKKAIDHSGFSARVYDRIIKVARTIADLSGTAQIKPEYISEAIQYRSLDKKYWN